MSPRLIDSLLLINDLSNTCTFANFDASKFNTFFKSNYLLPGIVPLQESTDTSLSSIVIDVNGKRFISIEIQRILEKKTSTIRFFGKRFSIKLPLTYTVAFFSDQAFFNFSILKLYIMCNMNLQLF